MQKKMLSYVLFCHPSNILSFPMFLLHSAYQGSGDASDAISWIVFAD